MLLCLPAVAVVTQYLRLLFFPYLQSQKISIFHMNPHAYTHRHINTLLVRRSTPLLTAAKTYAFPYSAADAGCFSDFVALTRRHTSLTFARFFSRIVYSLSIYFCCFFFFSVLNNNFSRKFSSFLFVVCFPPNNLECAFCVFCSLFRLPYTIHSQA